ncbi:MAG: hypothetical protein ACLFV7_11350 [Phycisphaerae bacterium]
MEYERMRLKQRTDYPRHTVVMYNIQRVLDPSVSGPDRAKSLELVEQLGQENPAIRVELARVLGAKETPPELRKAVLAMLLKRDHPDLAEHVVRVLAELEPDDPMRATVLDWLTRHPTEGVLAEVVALWAREPDADGYNRRYERVVERISGQNWATALLEGLNSDGFTARGSAIEVLSRRLGAKELARRIRQMSPRTVSVLAMQTFLTEFDYLPESAEQLLSVVSLYRSENDDIDDASKEYRLWNQQHGYVFKVRDFHLLKSLAKDPLRPNLRRSHLILTIGRRLKELKHVRHNAPGRGRVNQGNFWVLSHKLTMADLWNVNLLSEMLARKRVQMALGIVADRDLSNTRTAMGGLVVYQNGQAEAMLYSQAADAPTNDLTYVPNKAAVLAGRDALCRFQGHFEKINNALRAGPGPQEIRHAEKENYYGLILTSLSQDSFAAHYYNPDGEVVSLGVYPFAGGRTAR